MIDIEKRNPGKYQGKYSKIVNGVKVQITEDTVVGRKFEILSFSREYNPAIPYIRRDGIKVNVYTGKDKIKVTETTTIENGKVISFVRR